MFQAYSLQLKNRNINKIMLVRELITDEIPPLKTTDTGRMALSWMEEFKVSHMPVIDGTNYVGMVSEADILDSNIPDQPLSNHPLTLNNPEHIANQHVYDAIRMASDMKLSVIPVVDEQNKYLGMVTINNLIQNANKMAAISEPGGILVLEMNVRDYSLTEVARIVETNDAKILSSYIRTLPGTDNMELTLKINKEELSGIIQTFERYNYNIVATFNETKHLEDLKNRYESFMKFINI